MLYCKFSFLFLEQIFCGREIPGLEAILGRGVKLSPEVHQKQEPRYVDNMIEILCCKFIYKLLLLNLLRDSGELLLVLFPSMTG